MKKRGLEAAILIGTLAGVVAAPKEHLSRWLLALGCFGLLLFFFSPPWAAYRAWSRAPELGFIVEVRRGVSVLEQVQHLGAAVTDSLHGAIQWRLLFPAIGHYLGLPAPLLFALAPLGCIAVLGFIITVLRRRGAEWSDTTLVAVILGAGSWFFSSVGWLGYYDSWLVLGLLIVAFAQSPRSVWLACIWAPWVDERFVVAAPLALLCRLAARRPGSAERERGEFASLTLGATLLAGFLIVRLLLLAGASGPRATIGGYLGALDLHGAGWSRILYGAWEGLRAGWYLALLPIAACWTERGKSLALAATAAVTLVVGLATAQDYSRSMMFLVPLALLGAMQTLSKPHPWSAPALRILAVAGLLLPAHLVMSNQVLPIHGFYHELAALENPPAVLRPETYELRAIHSMEAGNYASAETDLTLAIKLSDNPAGPSKQRGLLYASVNRWTDARADFTTMTNVEPVNPDAWFLLAQAELALGETSAARDDLQKATTLASADWLTRPDVARFQARLGQAK